MIPVKAVTTAIKRAIDLKRAGNSCSELQPGDNQLVAEEPQHRARRDANGIPIRNSDSKLQMEFNPYAGRIFLRKPAINALSSRLQALEEAIGQPNLTITNGERLGHELDEIEEALQHAKTAREIPDLGLTVPDFSPPGIA